MPGTVSGTFDTAPLTLTASFTHVIGEQREA